MGYANWFFSFRTVGKSGSPLRVQCFKILQILAGHIVISSWLIQFENLKLSMPWIYFGILWSFCTNCIVCPEPCSFWHLFSILHVKLFRILPCICKSVFKRVVPQLFSTCKTSGSVQRVSFFFSCQENYTF